MTSQLSNTGNASDLGQS